MRGPWNNEPTFEYRDAEVAVDGGSGMPEVTMASDELAVVKKAATRLQSNPNSDPMTGAMLGMGAADGGSTGNGGMAMDPKAAQLNAQQQMQSGSKEPPLAQNS